MEQLLLVTSCDSPAGIGASLRTHELTDGRTNGHTDVTLETVFKMCHIGYVHLLKNLFQIDIDRYLTKKGLTYV